MMAMRDITVILFTLNEEKALPLVIRSLKKGGIKKIVVVDGHSTDRTVEIAKKAGTEIIMQEGEGKGKAFQTFLERYDFRDAGAYIMLDADCSYDSSAVNQFAAMLQEYDVITGFRHGQTYTLLDFSHYIGNKMISFLVLLMYGKWNPDICTGYWAFKGSALKKMNITADKFDLEADLFSEVCRKKLRHRHIDTKYFPRVGERKLKTSDALLIIKRLVVNRFTKK